METFDPNAAAGAEFKNPLSDDDDKDEKSSSKSSSSKKSDNAVVVPDLFGGGADTKEPSELGSIFGESKDNVSIDDEQEKPSLLSGLISREQAPNDGDEFEEVAEVSETGVETLQSDEQLTDDETHYVAQTLVEASQADAATELAEVDQGSPEEVEAAASAALFDAMKEHLDAGTDPAAAIETAAQETLQEINEMAEAEPARETNEATSPELDAEAEDEDDPTTLNQSTQTAGRNTPPVPPIPPPPGGPGRPTTPPHTQNVAAHGGGGHGSGNPSAHGASPNVLPVPMPVSMERRRGTRAGDMLLGGILGYLIGRRRGRRKSEKELLPIQAKLEKQVKELQKSIDEKEEQVREAAREQLAPKVAAPEQAPRIMAEQTPEKRAVRPPEVSSEKVAAESTSEISNTELRPYRPEVATVDADKVDWRVAAFNEVLVAAASIEVRDKNLRRSIKEMFERGLITKEEVRRLVVEHARGATPEQLRPRLKEIEAQELDPDLRQTRESDSPKIGESIDDEVTAEHAALPIAQPQTHDDRDTPDSAQAANTPVLDSPMPPPPHHEKDHTKAAVIGGVAVGLLIALSVLLWLK